MRWFFKGTEAFVEFEIGPACSLSLLPLGFARTHGWASYSLLSLSFIFPLLQPRASFPFSLYLTLAGSLSFSRLPSRSWDRGSEGASQRGRERARGSDRGTRRAKGSPRDAHSTAERPALKKPKDRSELIHARGLLREQLSASPRNLSINP